LGEAGRRRVIEQYDLNKNTDLLARLFLARLGKSVGAGARIMQGGMS
jgi:hypothetical protein